MGLASGDRLGRYEIRARVGAGGMGEVYRAHDEVLDREVAVKVLHEEVASDPKRLERFEREARAVAKLSHPNILEIHDFGSEDGVAYAVTELLEGESLRDHLARQSEPLAWKRVCDIGAAVADGLAAAHSGGVVHRDLKPANLFLTSDGRVKILDFGLARTVQPAAGEDDATETVEGTLTEDGAIMGTVGYMAPEQVPNRIAVVPFVNRPGDPSLDSLGALAADRIAQGLAELDELEVTPASAVVAAVGVDRPTVVREVAEGTGAGLVLTGAWDSMGDALELQATLEDAQNRTVARVFDPIRCGRDAPQDAVATLRDWTLMAAQDHLHPVLAFASGDGFPTIDAYQQYRLSLESFDFEQFTKLFELAPT